MFSFYTFFFALYSTNPLFSCRFVCYTYDMETRINKKVPQQKRRLLREGWQERLPIRAMLIGLAVVLLLVVILLINSPTQSYLGSAEMDVVRSRGILRVGVDTSVYGLNVDGNGYEAELARAVAAEIFGEDAEALSLVEVTRQTALWQLHDGQIDLALAAVAAPADSAYAVCARPFLQESCVLLGYAPSAPTTGSEIAVLNGTAAQELLDTYLKDKDPSLVAHPYAAYYDMLVALRAGTVDALCLPRSVAMTLLESGMHIYEAPLIGVISYYAFCRSEDAVLTNYLDEYLYERSEDGSLAELYKRFDIA